MATQTRDGTAILAAKVGVTASALFIAGGMASTSMQFIPALITAVQRAPSRPSASSATSGRLTPQPSESKTLEQSSLAGNSSYDGYKAAAQQFVSMSKTAFATQVPLELLSILASTSLAYRSYSRGITNAGHKWAALAVLVASIFPLTGGFMVPLDHKIARLGGEEEKLETYEDAPPDREAERRNTVEFLGRWDTLNRLRSVIMFTAGGLGLWQLVEQPV